MGYKPRKKLRDWFQADNFCQGATHRASSAPEQPSLQAARRYATVGDKFPQQLREKVASELPAR